MRALVVTCLIFLLTACESNPPAPVIERTPQTSKPKPPVAAKPIDLKMGAVTKMVTVKDWRPDTHTVAKGETLFGIGLQYGIDYKEIAAANNIASPYPIRIGQKLDLSSFKTKTVAATDATKTDTTKTDDGVIVTPIKVEPVTTGTATKPNSAPAGGSAVMPILNEPKATRETYSVTAWSHVTPKLPEIKSSEIMLPEIKPSEIKTANTKPTEAKPSAIKPAETSAMEAKTSDDESLTWGWPTQGKVSAGFNEASNKGIDIAGSTGQTINAAAPGKVIYSGSDLRGYGKLVIIKHNKTYLSVYAHNSKIVVKEGQSIAAGQKIAEMGNTDANSVKLHFEIRRLGKSVDPAKYLNQN